MYGPGQPGLLRRLHQFPAHHTMATRDFDGCRTCSLVEECGHCRAFVTGSGRPLFGNDLVCRDALPPVLGPLDRGPTPETVTVRS